MAHDAQLNNTTDGAANQQPGDAQVKLTRYPSCSEQFIQKLTWITAKNNQHAREQHVRGFHKNRKSEK